MRPARRNVVVLFIDIVGSTELAERLDPELLLRILEGYYDACRTAIFEHGGVVEKYIGDAIMAVFGVPVSREDDALRAVLAADAAMSAVHRLNAEIALDAHCGIAYGEVIVVSVSDSDVRIVGDTVNTAARLQSAAGDGEILLGEGVARQVMQHAVLAGVPPLTLKGKRDPVPAWRLVAVEPDRPEQEADTTLMVDRDVELSQLTSLYERIVAERRCGIATLLGVPGIGKSRLVREFLQRLPGDVTVLSGRCPSFGIGATYRPIAEMLAALDGRWPDLAAAVGPDSERALRGLADHGIAEIAQAVRTLFEVLAERQPLVVVVDNLQWAEPTLLDLVEDCASWLADVPVLLVCVARPELYENRPSWGGGVVCAMSLELGPLGRTDMERLVASRADVVAHGDDTDLGRVIRAADGNPLFAELMLETSASLPPTIQALLGARLDRLGTAERDTLERAATAGQTFTAGQVELLLGEQAGVPLRRLQRERLIRRGAVPGSYEFTQTLTRETVYALTSKEARAGWHLQLADFFPVSASGEVSQHLLAACRFTREVRPGDPLLGELTDRAAESLIRDGGQALHRRDLPAAIALLEHGRDILPAGRGEHRRLAVRISDAELARGESARAARALDRAEELLPGDQPTRLTCAIQREMLAFRSGVRTPLLDPLREQLADDLSRCRFHQLEALVHTGDGRFGAADRALREGLVSARAMGDQYEEDRLLGGLCELVQWSPTPVREGLDLCAGLLERFSCDRALLVPVLVTRARLLALGGDVDQARATLDTAGGYADDLHLDLPAIAVTQVRGLVESLDGNHSGSRTLFLQAAAALRAAGHGAPASTLEVYAAREALRQGDVRQAAAELTSGEGFRAELVAMVTAASIASLDGAHDEAMAGADRAVALLDSTDDPCLHGDVLFEAARIHRASGRQADVLARRALDAYLGKGAGLPARKVHDWMGQP
ncbi:AAA family ATPase [Nonomuraea sp. NPDC050556]|uniref:AAA family ATPase n=1 Tax=Nonomuraea sp. NPDC050556 TaxID=3364369 RepID=UPI003793A36A